MLQAKCFPWLEINEKGCLGGGTHIMKSISPEIFILLCSQSYLPGINGSNTFKQLTCVLIAQQKV